MLIEQSLRLKQARYRNLNEVQSEVMPCSDLTGNLTFFNDTYCRVFGRSREQLIGQTCTPTVSTDDLHITIKSMQALESPPPRNRTETCHSTIEGIRTFRWENTAVLDERGYIIELSTKKITPFLRPRSARAGGAPYEAFYKSSLAYTG